MPAALTPGPSAHSWHAPGSAVEAGLGDSLLWSLWQPGQSVVLGMQAGYWHGYKCDEARTAMMPSDDYRTRAVMRSYYAEKDPGYGDGQFPVPSCHWSHVPTSVTHPAPPASSSGPPGGGWWPLASGPVDGCECEHPVDGLLIWWGHLAAGTTRDKLRGRAVQPSPAHTAAVPARASPTYASCHWKLWHCQGWCFLTKKRKQKTNRKIRTRLCNLHR